jgi:hypothetical protein
MQKEPTRKIPADGTLYFTDNGRLLCGNHLGASAAYTGRDISGQRIARVRDGELAALAAEVGHPAGCETCTASARRAS